MCSETSALALFAPEVSASSSLPVPEPSFASPGLYSNPKVKPLSFSLSMKIPGTIASSSISFEFLSPDDLVISVPSDVKNESAAVKPILVSAE
jgi:hypothetical protein